MIISRWSNMMVFDGFDVSVVSLRRWRHCIIALCTHLLLVSSMLASGSHVSHPSTVSHHRGSTSETCFAVLWLAEAAALVFLSRRVHSRPAHFCVFVIGSFRVTDRPIYNFHENSTHVLFKQCQWPNFLVQPTCAPQMGLWANKAWPSSQWMVFVMGDGLSK